METKDIISISISLLSVVISICAFFFSRKASIKSSKVEASSKLSEIQEKIRAGRVIMGDIFHLWTETYGQQIKPELLRIAKNDKDKNHFMDFYNENYHSQPNDTKERKMSDEIHTYLHELHHLWNRYLNKEFSEDEIMNRFSPAINMDSDLIMLYLEAHWKQHDELKKETKDRWWKYVPTIIERAKNWENKLKN